MRFVYTEAEWAASAGHYPLRDRPAEDLMLLHRHWMWANQIRVVFEQTLTPEGSEFASPAILATRNFGYLFIWYALLWAVIEACTSPKEGRKIEFRGPFNDDIQHVSNILRLCRNAILHVPKSGAYIDDRLLNLVSEPGSAVVLRRIHAGFGRLFIEEFQRRGPAS